MEDNGGEEVHFEYENPCLSPMLTTARKVEPKVRRRARRHRAMPFTSILYDRIIHKHNWLFSCWIMEEREMMWSPLHSSSILPVEPAGLHHYPLLYNPAEKQTTIFTRGVVIKGGCKGLRLLLPFFLAYLWFHFACSRQWYYKQWLSNSKLNFLTTIICHWWLPWERKLNFVKRRPHNICAFIWWRRKANDVNRLALQGKYMGGKI